MALEKPYLIINLGSSSKRYALYRATELLLTAHFTARSVTFTHPTTTVTQKISSATYNKSAAYFLKYAQQKKVILPPVMLKAIGIRIVAPGTFFTKTHLITPAFIKKLTIQAAYAPLHIPPVLDEYKKITALLPQTPCVGISDSAFHVTIPEHARLYALAPALSKKYDLYRFGYHGISAQACLPAIKKLLNVIPPRIIICHLGGGTSVTAIYKEKSIDTSMGFSPLEGIPMMTRSGSIDICAATKLQDRSYLSSSELITYLSKESGIYGLAHTEDMRLLLKKYHQNDARAQKALHLYIYQIQKHIGAYSTILGGVDLLLFTGKIGEKSPEIRSLICSPLAHLGCVLDETKNKQRTSNALIEHTTSKIRIAACDAQEVEGMAFALHNFYNR